MATSSLPTLAPLAKRLNDLCESQPFSTGWYLKELRTGEQADRAGDVAVPSASTRKIAILMAALREVRAGRLSLEQRVTIGAEYQISTSGVFQNFRPGFTITLHDVLLMMIVVSDNACTGIVADMLGLEAINEFSRSVGMKGTTHREGIPRSTLRAQAAPAEDGEVVGAGAAERGVNETTPADVGLLLELILSGSDNEGGAQRLGATPVLCRLALDILSWQKLNTRLPLLLPVGTKVAHKTGTGSHCYNDAGLVYHGAEPRFILTVYTHQVPRVLPDGSSAAAATSLLIGGMARACWEALT